jgi:HD-GYP domain-containing protein (c-di-GMP phosphodiesterase class II)
MVCIILAALALISSAMLLMLRYKINNLQKTISVLNNNIVEKSELDKLLNILLQLNEFSLKEQDSFDKSKFLNKVVNEVYKFSGVGSAAVILLDDNTNEVFISSSKEQGSIDPELEAKFELNVADIVLENSVPILVNDKLSDIATKLFQKDNSNTYKSLIAAPIKINNKIIGVLTVVALPNGRIFNSKDLNLIVIIADQTASILDNRILYHNFNDFYFETLKTLIRTIDAKDHYTFNHSERTEQYAKLIAEKLNLSSEIVSKIEFAALVHDIGKVGIAGHILNKIERLREDEKEVLKMHPIIGYNIIAPLTFLSSVAPIVLYHQEWYNGKGYPEGLSGEEIPLGARIISVIDAYDAMICDRPYRKALGKEYAITEIEKGMGTQFDPEAAKTFIDILKSNSTASKYRINKTV